MMVATSAFLAAKDAIYAARACASRFVLCFASLTVLAGRSDAGHNEYFVLNTPATPDVIHKVYALRSVLLILISLLDVQACLVTIDQMNLIG